MTNSGNGSSADRRTCASCSADTSSATEGACSTRTNEHSAPVYQLLTNYQNLEDSGLGYLRLVRFLQAVAAIIAEAYSPPLLEYHPDPTHCSRINDAFGGPG